VKDDRIYLLHIHDAIHRIIEYTTEGEGAFFASSKTQDAVVRNLEIIGEAAKNLSEGLKTRHGSVPWKRIAGMRDKMIHEYFGVNLKLVWEVVEREPPPLKVTLKSMLRELGGNP
jgi:uncharacterized protein with HEPN domain